jgi:hypothetical protein
MAEYKLTEKKFAPHAPGRVSRVPSRYDGSWRGMTSLDFGTILPNGNRLSPFGVESVPVADARVRPCPFPAKSCCTRYNQVEGRYKGARPLRGRLGGLAARELKNKDRKNNPYMMLPATFL